MCLAPDIWICNPPQDRPVPLGDQKPQLHVSAQQVYLVQEEVHVLPAHLRADHHLAEEVDLPPVGLIAQHQASLLHHPLLNGWGHLHGQRGWAEVNDQNSKASQLLLTSHLIFTGHPLVWLPFPNTQQDRHEYKSIENL